MNLKSKPRVIVLSILLSNLALPGVFSPSVSAHTQDAGVALQRGFRTGYSDGYMSGYRDTIDSVAKNYARHTEYSRADRAYNKDYGALEDYRDGYQQGFESGYETGYERRSFESNLPARLKNRGVAEVGSQVATTTTVVNTPTIDHDATVTDPDTNATAPITTTFQSNNYAIIVIPRDTELILELQEDLNTEQSREGEKFTARVVSPSEIAGAVVEGRVAKILKPGRINRRSELLLSFDRIILNDNRWSNFGATLTEVLAVKGDNVKRVDSEGTALGQSSLKSDAAKVGGATGAGLVVGAVVGGPVGAAVGAGMGAAFGVGAVVIERGKHVRLNRNQQLRIKTSYQTQIR
ncbi:MAG: hypothetical protein ABIV48_02895 [Pyrinomonadaceae bacterium]